MILILFFICQFLLSLLPQISLKAGRNVIIWQATAISYGEHDKREPVYIKSIEIQGWCPFLLVFTCNGVRILRVFSIK